MKKLSQNQTVSFSAGRGGITGINVDPCRILQDRCDEGVESACSKLRSMQRGGHCPTTSAQRVRPNPFQTTPFQFQTTPFQQ